MTAQKRLGREEMLQATLQRDASYDGLFLACVKTTGIFCRPSCPARKPLPKNIEFHTTVQDCLFAGYRPCMRCKPLAMGDDIPEWLTRLLVEVEANPERRLTDDCLRSLHISPHAARRYFQRTWGLTFQAYHRARRIGLAHQRIKKGGSDLAAALDHGYESLSGFRDAYRRTIGTTPARSKEMMNILTRTIDTPIGSMVACASDEAVCYLDFADRTLMPRHLERIKAKFHAVIVPGVNDLLQVLAAELAEYFAKERRLFSVPLASPGTPFQESVWTELSRIPYGQTRSYDDIARAIGKPQAHRAVGHANSENPVAIIVPCHRVIRRDGSLSGYGGGLWRKHYLLELEGAAASANVDENTTLFEMTA